MISDVKRLLTEAHGLVRVLDACAGTGDLARQLLSKLREAAKRVYYTPVDRNSASIDRITADTELQRGYGHFNPMLRDICDLRGLRQGSFDLVIVNNTLHEIPPHLYPRALAELNRLLRPGRGQLVIIDMEILPTDFAEAIAITWTEPEILELLGQAGFRKPYSSEHDKSVPVYQVHVRRTEAVLTNKLLRALVRLIQRKTKEAVQRRKELNAAIGSEQEDFIGWMVQTGSLARYTEELMAIQSAMKSGLPAAVGPDRRRDAVGLVARRRRESDSRPAGSGRIGLELGDSDMQSRQVDRAADRLKKKAKALSQRGPVPMTANKRRWSRA